MGSMQSVESDSSNQQNLLYTLPKTTVSEPVIKPGTTNTNSKTITQKKHNLSSDIVEVYHDNFFKEIERISSLVPEYNYISMVSLRFAWPTIYI